MKPRPDRAPQWVAALSLALCVVASAGATEWRVVREPTSHVLPGFEGKGFDPYQLHFADMTHGWIIGGFHSDDVSFVGYRTVDGGETWRDIRIPGFYDPSVYWWWNFDATSVFMLDAQHGWIGGPDRVAYSADGGETWELRLVSPRIVATPQQARVLKSGNFVVTGTHFWSRQEGILTGWVRTFKGDVEGSAVLRTDDGGDTWHPLILGDWAWTIPQVGGSRLSMRSDRQGWLTNPFLYYTASGGSAWDRPLPGSGVVDAFLDGHGMAWAIAGAVAPDSLLPIAHSSDNGTSWAASTVTGDQRGVDAYLARTGLRRISLSSLSMAPGNRGWSVGWGGAIVATEDGISWYLQRSPTAYALNRVQYVDGVVYAVGDGGIVLRKDTDVPTTVHPGGKLPTTWAGLRTSSSR
ncbi:hypothetical protein FJZ36_17970 [Candidatus Poribacteria bacterium]|nr:hypothetical protein [Candidatus Poribacteria bacterium]